MLHVCWTSGLARNTISIPDALARIRRVSRDVCRCWFFAWQGLGGVWLLCSISLCSPKRFSTRPSPLARSQWLSLSLFHTSDTDPILMHEHEHLRRFSLHAAMDTSTYPSSSGSRRPDVKKKLVVVGDGAQSILRLIPLPSSQTSAIHKAAVARPVCSSYTRRIDFRRYDRHHSLISRALMDENV